VKSYQHMTPIERFATCIVGQPLYAYQAEAANAILYSIEHKLGWIITIMMSRQSGKNQLSAILEAFLLFTRQEGVIVKAAPTLNPQIANSRRRLMSMLNNPYCQKRIWTSYAQIGLAPSANARQIRQHTGPSVMFFSADPDSNVVGATANLLLEIDEAQDVSATKFDKDFRPMAATTNATTVMYGTAWSDDTLLACQRVSNLIHEQRSGERRHFEYDWHAAAACNPNYQKFVQSEIERLGAEHLAVQTQYFLHPISGAGHFFNDLQRQLLAGKHNWQESAEPQADHCYISGLDIGGEERPDPQHPERVNLKRDSTVLSIGRISYNEINLPCIEIVHQVWWTGKSYTEQYAALVQICEQWDLRRLVIDNTGQGAGLAALLSEKLGEERVEAYTFTRPSKSRLGYQLLTLINSGRFKIYQQPGAPRQVSEECWKQINKARYRLPAPEVIDFFVEASEGHDDFLVSLALTTQALEGLVQPASAQIIRSRRYYEGESRY
jgi:hypothetical protein